MPDEKNITTIRPQGIPSPKQQSWGLLVSIAIIVLMIIIGAFYAWGKRIAQQQVLTEHAGATSSPVSK